MGISSGRIIDRSGMGRFPIGIEDFARVVQDFTYVDKSLLIRDLIDGNFNAVLFCRPRRFGKSLAMRMLQCYFEAPVTQGYMRGYREKAVDFHRAWLTDALKATTSLYLGVLTGVQRVSREFIFSGLNNIVVETALDPEFAERSRLLAGNGTRLHDLHDALLDGNGTALEAALRRILLDSPSAIDLVRENSYHMLLVGLLYYTLQ